MADSAISLLDSAGVTRLIDAQTVGTDFQQTVTIGDGVNAGRLAGVEADASLRTINNSATNVAVSSVTGTTTATTAVAARATRRGAIIFHESTGTPVLYLLYGTTGQSGTVSSSNYTLRLAANTSYFLDVPLWVGAIQCVWTGTVTTTFARITDIYA